ncbi:hypothetical protein M4L39_14485 [Staphylococcus equorum]|uniref:hypothetical protein n=1 Tax=Staphylococcus equorum TaxID=246432 RepID=UPI00240882F0|nr:hypothetical protein [Staphylococcus equorum]MDG0844613.1 hypothetical protein [Staphylococcus equorum]
MTTNLYIINEMHSDVYEVFEEDELFIFAKNIIEYETNRDKNFKTDDAFIRDFRNYYIKIAEYYEKAKEGNISESDILFIIELYNKQKFTDDILIDKISVTEECNIEPLTNILKTVGMQDLSYILDTESFQMSEII